MSARLHRRRPAIDAVLRADIRRRWRSWLLLATVGGCLVGLVVACAAGARRTSSAFDRYASAANAADVSVEFGDDALNMSARLSRVDGVSNVGFLNGVGQMFVVRDGRVVESPRNSSVVTVHGALVEGVDRMSTVEGRLPHAGADEGVASELWLDQMDVGVGDTVRFRFADDAMRRAYDGLDQLTKAMTDDPTLGRTYDITIVGRGVTIDDIARDGATQPARLVIRGDTAAHMLGLSEAEVFSGGTALITFSDHDGASAAATEAALRELPLDWSTAKRLSANRASVILATEPYVRALWISAAVAAIIGLGIFGGALAREAVSDAAEDGRLRSLGADRATLRWLVVLRAGIVSGCVVIVSVIVAIGASVGFPVGPTTALRVHRSVSFDSSVIVVAALVVVCGAALVSLFAVHRIDRTSKRLVRRSGPRLRLAESVPLEVQLGVRLAHPFSGPLRVVMRSARIGVGVAMACGSAVAICAASLDDLVGDPARHGWNWDVLGTCNEGYCDLPSGARTLVRAVMAREPSVEAWTFVTYGALQVNGQSVPFVGVGPTTGRLDAFTITRGRAPTNRNEVALGASTLRGLHQHIGQRLAVDGVATGFRIVGEAVFPGIGQLDAQRASLGVGAALTHEGASAVLGGEFNPDGVLIQLDEHASEFSEEIFPGFVLIEMRPPGALAAWGSLRALTFLSVGGLAVLALASVLHARSLAGRLQARELAVLETLGMETRQIHRSLRWQSISLLSSGALVGVPIGIFLGLRAWTIMTTELAVESPPRLISSHLTLACVALALVVVVLALTAQRRRVAPAATFHAE